VSQRELSRAQVGWPRALRELKDLLYETYLAADKPTLDTIVEELAADGGLPGSPRRDTVYRCISEASMPPAQADVASIAAVLARRAAWDIEDLTSKVRQLWNEARSQASAPAGDLISSFHDRRVVEVLAVHQALAPDQSGSEVLPALPTYVRRRFDDRLREVVQTAADGAGAIAVLVGGSSTGKTRACWEAVRGMPVGWRLWCPPPSPPSAEAVVREIDGIAPYTVIWLNEAQNILAPERHGEQLAAAIKRLVHMPGRGPILVLGTLWPEHWDALTRRPEVMNPDIHEQARALLDGHALAVPGDFAEADPIALAAAASSDPRLAQAAARAIDGQITQYLAGVPVLIDRYEAAVPAVKAVLHAAMDARRLGAGPHLPLAWLAEAGPGYLTDTQWNKLEDGDGWLHNALAYVTEPAKGIPGLLTRIRSDAPRNRRNSRRFGAALPEDHSNGQGMLYQLADYLEQYGRRRRVEVTPPIDFWTAAAAHARLTDLDTLGDAAWHLGLYRDAAQLYKNAAMRGNTRAAFTLIDRLHGIDPSDPRPKRWAISMTALDDPASVEGLLKCLDRAEGNEHLVEMLSTSVDSQIAVRHPAATSMLLDRLHQFGANALVTQLAERSSALTAIDHPLAVSWLLNRFHRVGAARQIPVLAERAAAGCSIDEPTAVSRLLDILHQIGAHDQLAVLAERAAAGCSVDKPAAVSPLLDILHQIGARDQVALLAERTVARCSIDNPTAVSWLLIRLRRIGGNEHLISILAQRAASEGAVHDPSSVVVLLACLNRLGSEGLLVVLSERAAKQGGVNDPSGVGTLLDYFHRTSGTEQLVAVLAERAVSKGALDNPGSVAVLLDRLCYLGADEQAVVLAQRAASKVAVNDPDGVSRLLRQLYAVGTADQVAMLARRAAAWCAVDNPDAVGELLICLHTVGMNDQVAVLARRAASEVPVNEVGAVLDLLDTLRFVGTGDEATTLSKRAGGCDTNDPRALSERQDYLYEVGPNRHYPLITREIMGRASRVTTLSNDSTLPQFGVEPDGIPAPPWSWDDLV
jgi:hypothetical protein